MGRSKLGRRYLQSRRNAFETIPASNRVGEASCNTLVTFPTSARNCTLFPRDSARIFLARVTSAARTHAVCGRYGKRETDRRDNATGNWRFHCIMADFRFLARNDSVRLVTFIMAFKNMNGARAAREQARVWADVATNTSPLTFRTATDTVTGDPGEERICHRSTFARWSWLGM